MAKCSLRRIRHYFRLISVIFHDGVEDVSIRYIVGVLPNSLNGLYDTRTVSSAFTYDVKMVIPFKIERHIFRGSVY